MNSAYEYEPNFLLEPDTQFLSFEMCTNVYIHRGSYLACGTSMLDDTTLRFCSRRDTDRVSGSRLTLFPSTGLCSSTASGLRQPPSNFWPSETLLLELCCGGVKREISHSLRWNINSEEGKLKTWEIYSSTPFENKSSSFEAGGVFLNITFDFI